MLHSHHSFRLTFILAIALTIGLTGCAGLEDTSILTPPPGTPTPVPSPTIVWFPPSATPTPQVFPTKAPTPEQKPGIGSVAMTDDFSSPLVWDTATSDQAGVNVSNHQLTIAVQPGVFADSFRKDVILSDFYAEITASLSLCRGQDEYGFLFRAPNSVAFYTYALSCDGHARVERTSVATHLPLQPPTPSGDVPTGAPGQTRLGVWAVGPDLRFFLNGRYQFSVNDRSYASGGIGVFAHSVGDTPVTVIFSNLAVYDVTYTPPTRTPKP